MKRDGHIHTPYCPHGSKDSLRMYIERAIELNFSTITFTEHAPLPNGFIDPVPDKDSAMLRTQLEDYINDIQSYQQQYKSNILIHVGLEIDYIEGYEEQTREFLTTYGPYLNDSILSVHFLKKANNYYCIDFSEDEFARIAEIYGSVDNVHSQYYSTVKSSIKADLGIYKPKRLGHITLVNKFQKKFASTESFESTILSLLDDIKAEGYELDYNGAGISKPLCKQSYPAPWVVKEAIKRNIPLVYGSDAHAAQGVGQHYEALVNALIK
ncbi:histidinol-phosphatase HisJ [Bacillus sp. HMF5848]|uniref:histidinol-phosphatase HisJ n=1 Tax=Bacillus sp. HMF5848 TaxID=2495421 RepID=UPI000F76DEE9|nr:histidinol-phosphatase HisJ [Bacillus sp. HMF5848]RSK28186.1 histidinol-phosphatase HisJ [Bacillus sp. HMF5848]